MDFLKIAHEKNKMLESAETTAKKWAAVGMIEEAQILLRNMFLFGIEEFGKSDPRHPIVHAETGLFSAEGIPISDLLLQIEDTVAHKRHVVAACAKMASALNTNVRHAESERLMNRAYIHDISKLNNDEFFGMARFASDVESMKNKAVARPSEEKMKAIRLHWSRNSHHPEFHADLKDMEEMDVIEMCCDWRARSLQFGTDLMEWVDDKLLPRFQFDAVQERKIKVYCRVLAE